MNEIERNRLEAYLNGWDDGYAEGYAKAAAEADHAARIAAQLEPCSREACEGPGVTG
jgi:flagellar biosynthesis/type III secretory pathway protein FliH